MIEVIFSLFIIAIGLTGAILLVSSSLHNSVGTRDQITASHLAQEGIEIVRNIRDSNWKAVTPRTSFEGGYFPEISSSDNLKCKVQYSTVALFNSPTAGFNCNNAYNDATTDFSLYLNGGYYSTNASGGTITRFKRKTAVVYYNSTGTPGVARNLAASAKIISIVSWSGGNVPAADLSTLPTNCTVAAKCVYLQDTLTKWME